MWRVHHRVAMVAVTVLQIAFRSLPSFSENVESMLSVFSMLLYHTADVPIPH
jgi:hypothetical protein